MALPSDLQAVLILLGRAFEGYYKLTETRAILVGGAVVSIFSEGAYISGDLDVLVALDGAFDAALKEQGFRREDRVGRIERGWYHPDHPRYGVDSVSKPYFDGNGDVGRVRVLVLGPDSKLNVAALEDMIADRLGQYAASTTDPRPLVQAKLLFALGGRIDFAYLQKRVGDEGGDLTRLLDDE